VTRLRLFIRGLAFGLLILLRGSPASAHTIALLQPPSHSANTTDLLQRLRGELLSVGFEVVLRERSSESEPGASSEGWQRRLAAEATVEGAVDVVGDAAPVAVDVWIVDRARQLQRLARVRLEANSEGAFKGVAIRASEVLRARLFETHVEPTPPPTVAAPPRVVPVADASAEAERQPSWGVELGVAALASLDGVGPAFLPLVRFDWASESEFVVQATLAGFGTRPSIVTAAGNANVAMQYGLLGAGYRLNWQPVKPFGVLSLGALRTAVVGEAALPREGHSVDQWSFLLDASLGAVLQLSRRYTVIFAGHAQLAQPYSAVRFGDQKVASVGRPNLLLTLTVGAWL